MNVGVIHEETGAIGEERGADLGTETVLGVDGGDDGVGAVAVPGSARLSVVLEEVEGHLGPPDAGGPVPVRGLSVPSPAALPPLPLGLLVGSFDDRPPAKAVTSQRVSETEPFIRRGGGP
jgi:hypothetical protein